MRELQISEETYEKIKEQLQADEIPTDITDYDGLIGNAWFFRTVTYHCVGVVEARFGDFVRLSQASWVPDSGRFMAAIKAGTLSEVEPVGVQYLNLKTVVDFFPWIHPLPKEQK